MKFIKIHICIKYKKYNNVIKLYKLNFTYITYIVCTKFYIYYILLFT